MFSDSDLMMLEQITYIGDAAKMCGVSAKQVPGETIGERLAVFDETALAKLEESGSEGQQWAAIIRHMQSDPDMCALVQGESFTQVNDEGKKTILATAYYNPAEPDKAIVTFKGTTTAENWFDNATGLGTSDTEVQKEALEYINSLPYGNVTVVGHSKGGNLAQYVTITSDKVDRCVSMDGQGFSQEFMDKYWAEIQLKADRITNYSLSEDYVHGLLFPIPGAKQDYCKGDRVDNPIEYHYSNSFFQYKTEKDENGNTITVIDTENGDPVIINNQTENEMMTYLHEFTCFVLYTMPKEDRVRMGEYVGNILQMAMTGQPVNGYTDVLAYALSDPEMLSMVLAYFIRYVEINNLSEDEAIALLKMLGLEDLLVALEEVYEEHKTECDIAIGATTTLLQFFLNQIKDGKEDKFIKLLLKWLQSWLEENVDIPDGVNLPDLWQNTENAYHDIPNSASSTSNYTPYSGYTCEYTQAVYDSIMNTIQRINNMGSVSVSSWSNYSSEDWYDNLYVQYFIKGIKKYNSKLTELNSVAKNKTDYQFSKIARIDAHFGQELSEQASDLNVLILALQ